MRNHFIIHGETVLFSSLATFCILLSGCVQNTHEMSDGVYLNSSTDVDSNQMAISLNITENDFEFGVITKDSSFLAGGLKGIVEIERDTVTAITDGGTLTYTFKIIDNNTISFVQDESDDLVMASGNTHSRLTDGTEFTLID